jgi:hypothetical protein
VSLDVYLTVPGDTPAEPREAILVRKAGRIVEISREEWDRHRPDRPPVLAKTAVRTGEVFSANITHNLGRMAAEAGIYIHLWRPEELGITKARELIAPLQAGLALMKSEPERFEAHNPANGWGSYDVFVPWIEEYLAACQMYPDADVSVWC